MNYRLKLLLCLTLLIPIAGCGTNDTETNAVEKNEKEIMGNASDPLPVMSLNYEGSNYKFNEIIPKEEIDMSQIVYTGTYTESGDRVENGKEIIFYKRNNSVFIIDDNGPTEEWVNFTEFEKQ